ncbi:MAG: hypothetical protein RLY93_02105 [Sumerlaeia bacterium]
MSQPAEQTAVFDSPLAAPLQAAPLPMPSAAPSGQPTSPPFIGYGLLLVMAFFGVFGLLAVWVFPREHVVELNLIGCLVALVFLVVGVPLAVGNARLSPTARHTYNAHYAALLPMVLLTWTLGFADAIAPDSEMWQGLLRGLMVGSAITAAACLWTSGSAWPRIQWVLALGSAAVVIAISGIPALLPLAPLLIIRAMFYVPREGFAEETKERTRVTQTMVGFLSFGMINVLVIAGLIQPFLPLFRPVFQALGGEAETTPLLAGGLEDDLVSAVSLRLASGLAAALLCALFAFVWPHRRAGRASIGLGLLCLTLAPVAAGPAGQSTLLMAIVPLAAAYLLLLAGTSLVSFLPRDRRAAAAFLAAGVGYLLGLEFIRVDPTAMAPGWVLLMWVIEGGILASVWIGLYFLVVRNLRKLLDR